ncbi:MAG: hypothetical protein ACLP9L_00620 [Thermoguttaceae bacterium]
MSHAVAGNCKSATSDKGNPELARQLVLILILLVGVILFLFSSSGAQKTAEWEKRHREEEQKAEKIAVLQNKLADLRMERERLKTLWVEESLKNSRNLDFSKEEERQQKAKRLDDEIRIAEEYLESLKPSWSPAGKAAE